MAITGTVTKPHVVSGLVEPATGQMIVIPGDDGYGLEGWGSGDWGGGSDPEVSPVGGRIFGNVGRG